MKMDLRNEFDSPMIKPYDVFDWIANAYFRIKLSLLSSLHKEMSTNYCFALFTGFFQQRNNSQKHTK